MNLEILNKCNEFEKLAKESNKYVYHLKSPEFKGKIIYSLNKMKDIDEKIYKDSLKKYKGREDHITKKIKELNCTWSDVVNLSTLNPEKIFRLASLLGNKNHEYNNNKEIVCIPIENLIDSEFCLYDDNFSHNSAKAYSKLSINKYKELEFVPTETVKYFADCVEKNEDPLMFAYVKHILVKDQVNIKNSKIIKFKL